MLTIYTHPLINRFQQILSQSLILATIITTTQISITFSINTTAFAQTPNIDSTELTKYAKAVLAMEPVRQQAFEEIKKLIGSKDIPKIICNDPNTVNDLPGKAKDVAIKYCNNSQKIVKENKLTTERFNQITVEIQTSKTLEKQVYNTLLRLQKTSPTPPSK
ncbi:DUF4168 domain-containing protein [Cuspidothrix issatschenkoi]|jgi:hypothetical protein|uniref:DUF4168 domain-containing protein n=1 Tax=Cuspidothrix issatschenkoi CHARLIE-1 TaxID=2052836 RepID=A0A2S6CPJ6_9CYAN|nr:DUF4168 domain-containing protein [Cuspidothrix issatschenkoi]PPJ61560.1 hypothetical protein CUN59_20190 [Cuspidothrix issatschenkoi CHARLIE-1]